MTHARAAAVLGAAFALTVAGLALVGSSEHLSERVAPAIVYTLAALLFIVAGLVARLRRPENRTGAYLVAAGFTWYAGLLSASDHEIAFTVGVTLSSLPYALVVALALGYPTGTFPWRPDRVIVAATIALVTVGQLAFMMVARPEDLCSNAEDCPSNALLVTDNAAIAAGVRWALNVLIAVIATAGVWRMARRWRDASRALRRVVGPVYLAATTVIVSASLRIVLEDVSHNVAAIVFVVQVVALLGIPIAIVFGLVRSRLARGAVASLAVALDRGEPLRDALARALGDPSLAIAYPLPGTGWIDADGRAVPEPSDDEARVATPVLRDGKVIARVEHDDALADEPELVEGVIAAAGLALRAEGVQAEARAQFTLLQTLVDTVPSLFVHIDTDGRIRDVNIFAVEVAGYDAEGDVRGRLFWDVFIAPEERADVIERFEAARPDFSLGEYENVFVNRRGRRHVVFWRAAPVTAEGRVTGIISTGVDITAMREEAEARERERTFLNAIANDAPSLLCLVDENGVLAPAAANRAFEAKLELAADSVGGEVFWERFVVPEHAAEVEDTIRRVAAGERMSERDDVWVTATGARLDVAWTCTPLPQIDERRLFLVSGLDVTERRRRQEETQAQRDFLITVSRATPSFLAVIGPDGVISDDLGVNKAMWDIGYPDEHAMGKHFWDLVAPPDGRERFREEVLASLHDAVPRQRESDWVTADGRRIVVSWSCRPLIGGSNTSAWLLCGTDITDRRERELEVVRERDATTTVLQAIPGVIAVLDRQRHIRDRDFDNPLAAVNQSFKTTLGWDDIQLVGRDFLELVAEDDGSALQALEDAAAGSASAEVESEWRTRAGETVAVAWRALPVRDVTGRTEGLVLVSGVDITDRRRREVLDERRRAYIDALVEAIPSYLLVVTPDATMRAGGVNQAFAQTFGWTGEELDGKSFVGTVTPESDFPARMLIANAANGQAQPEIESRWDGRDGESRIVAWTARPVVGAMGEELVLVSGADVTLRRLQAEELRASRARIVGAADDARRRLERDLHDGAQQRLVALSVSLRLAESRAAMGDEGVPQMLAAARAELGVALEELRELARGIHPAILTDRGLGPALEALVARSPLPVTLEHPGERLPSAIEAAAYFVVAEGLTNVVKYAQATTASVVVELVEDCVCIRVSDDGVGGADASRGSGIRGITDRVAALDGVLSIESVAGEGTRLEARIPR